MLPSGTPQFRHRNLPTAREVITGHRGRSLLNTGHWPRVHDFATVLAGSGADVDNPVAFTNGFFVVFDNNHRVAQITQTSQRVDEPTVITLVQTDRRFVEHVQGANQTRTNLACEPNALRLSSRQRSRRSRQREVIEADIEQKSESSIDLFCHALGNHAISVGQF